MVASRMLPDAWTLVSILGQRLKCLCNNFGCLFDYNRVVRKAKVIDQDCPERESATRIFRHPPQYMVHRSVGQSV